MINNLIKYIKSFNVDGIEIPINGDIEIFYDKNKYSASNEPTLKIKMSSQIFKRTDKLTYECPNCHTISTIFIGKFISKNSTFCMHCKEKQNYKRDTQKEYVLKSWKGFGKIVPKYKNKTEKVLGVIIEDSIKSFSEENDQFKKDYFKRVPTILEFNKIKNSVKSIEGNIINKDIKYYPIVKNNNQMRYSPKVLIDGKLFLLNNCEFYCSICGDDFKGRNFKSKSNSDKILCQSCSFSNKIFKFKSILNISGDKVTYQSNPELKLIKHYNNNNIIIKNGPKIEYYLNGDKKIYKVDFEVPSNKFLIEVKGEHIWHRKEVESGKWQAKEKAAKIWCLKNGYTYHLLFNVDVLIK